MMMKTLEMTEWMVETYRRLYGEQPKIRKISGGGSSRSYFRLSSDQRSVIAMLSDNVKENQTFVRLDKCFRQEGVNVPEIIEVAANERGYLLQDLGDVMLLDLLDSNYGLNLAKEALNNLITIQTIKKSKWEELVSFAPFSDRLVMWDLNYFKYCFLKPIGMDFDENALENDFDTLRGFLTREDMIKGFMFRDFQSRNIMVQDNKLWFIDFQGGREGPVIYDLVSFLWQAKAPFTKEDRQELSDYYIQHYCLRTGANSKTLYESLSPMVLFRTLQVLGAYGLRGLIERKTHFLESIPRAVNNLYDIFQNEPEANYPELIEISRKLHDLYSVSKETVENELIVSVYSFSYKKGYPEDKSGNGGGFMFDCRGIHNPGRYEEYKNLTGMDKEVIEFLEKDGNAPKFIKMALEIVAPSVDTYLRRGFESLQVGFGCTGGQHRSVFCAEEFSRQLKEKFPGVKIRVDHRERGVMKYL